MRDVNGVLRRKDGKPDGRVRSGRPTKPEENKRNNKLTIYLTHFDMERLRHEAIGHKLQVATMAGEIVRRVLLSWEEKDAESE